MQILQAMHYGDIIHNETLIKTLFATSRQKLIYELNSWFFDYFYANKLDIRQLPALDDWTHSDENTKCWHVKFPDDTWTVTINYTLFDFGP